MGAPTFQGTLYKFSHGQTTSPARRTADRIAKHFKISVEALYDARAAAAEATRLQLVPDSGTAPDAQTPPQPSQLREPSAPGYATAWPLGPWITSDDWISLSPEERAAVAWEAKKALDAIRATSTDRTSSKRLALRTQ